MSATSKTKTTMQETVDDYFIEEEYGKSWVYTHVNDSEIDTTQTSKTSPQPFWLVIVVFQASKSISLILNLNPTNIHTYIWHTTFIDTLQHLNIFFNTLLNKFEILFKISGSASANFLPHWIFECAWVIKCLFGEYANIYSCFHLSCFAFNNICSVDLTARKLFGSE